VSADGRQGGERRGQGGGERRGQGGGERRGQGSGDRRGQGGAGRRDGQEQRRDTRGRQRGAARSEGRAGRTTAAPSQRARTGDQARGAAFDALRAVAESDAYANLVLPPLLRERGVTGRDAGFATELAYGALRLRGRYDAVLAHASSRPLDQVDGPVLDVLRLGAHQLLGMRVPSHAAVSETVALARERVGAGAAQFVNAVLRRVSERTPEEWLTVIGDAADPDGSDAVARLAAVESHPAWVVRSLREALVGSGRPADELPALLAADNAPPRVTLVARPGLVEPAELAEQGEVAPAGLVPTALVLRSGDPGALTAVREGRAGVQDEGSQLVTLALVEAPLDGPDERWLDLCAGPGGKAALLGALAAGRGARLVANEVQPHRARLVSQSLRAVPASAVEEVRTGDGREVGRVEPGSYDRVLLDAPCTGLGALRRRPESRWRRTPADLATLSALQRELLASAFAAVRPGGVVGYVTCSPHLAETQLVVHDAVRAAQRAGTSVEVLDATPVVAGVAPSWEPVAGRRDVQLWPHVHGTDAMHLTLLRRL
jgi:16S rRNA (cytosine967-C5)-methyltransferase